MFKFLFRVERISTDHDKSRPQRTIECNRELENVG